VKVLNIHERKMVCALERVGALIDSLSSSEDKLWQRHSGPRMEFDRPLNVGAVGGHGPIRYVVEEYTPGRSIQFRFTGAAGSDGYHRYDLLSTTSQDCILRHTGDGSRAARHVHLGVWPSAQCTMH
jgi:hypothetical protein